MPAHPFDASRLKVRRARFHIGDLTREVSTYQARSPFLLEIVKDASFVGGKKWLAHVYQEVPQEFSAIIGDVIHNLRTALDLTAGALARLNGKSARSVYFPFASTEADLDDAIKGRNFDRAGPVAVALLRTFEPYRGADNPLRAIHDLDIIDKHQMLLPLADMLGVPELIRAGERIRGLAAGPVRDGMEFAIETEHQRLPLGYQARGTLILRFPTIGGDAADRAPLAGQEIIPTLVSLANHVESVVEAFARLSG